MALEVLSCRLRLSTIDARVAGRTAKAFNSESTGQHGQRGRHVPGSTANVPLHLTTTLLDEHDLMNEGYGHVLLASPPPPPAASPSRAAETCC